MNKTPNFHPLCAMFPVMEKAELKELADDIEANGQREPIKLFQKQIIDGRNRFLACELIKRKPVFETVKEKDPAALVKSLNIFRRHLGESQRAMLAAELMKMGNGLTIAEASKDLNVSGGSIKSARKVIGKGVKAVKEAVKKGKLAVYAGAKLADLPKAEQRKAARTPESLRKALNKIGKPKRGKISSAELKTPRGGMFAGMENDEAEEAILAAAPKAVIDDLRVTALGKFAADYRKYWAPRVSPHSSEGAPSAAEQAMNDKVESLLVKHGAAKVESDDKEKTAQD
jgi:ParB-like chromosome segregation protein Spo0J